MKYKAHIVSHSHWDREWYMPYESHHMRLIELIDKILEEIEVNPDFNSFHLDGQTICIDDYLQVRPNKRNKLLAAIKDGKIKIGPWYILQDAFLTSSEANVRNLLYGHYDCKQYGAKTNLGYYPDTFGIYAQAPQILKHGEIDNMVFGRGVSATGFNNEVSDDFESKYSEMTIEGSDGTKALGILFANWYNNGDEIPVDETEAKVYWDKKIADASKYAKTKHLLFMNGCDHTPFPKDVTKAISVANKLYPDVEFVHSNFNDYLKEVKKELNNGDLSVVKGELKSQKTDGRYTLVNTASTRIHQKISNVKLEDKYEKLVEPLQALLLDEEDYKHDEIMYGWKTLMQNHPHDSICGCSVDSVHRLMDQRFERANDVADFLINDAMEKFCNKLTLEKDSCQFVVVNPLDVVKQGVHSTVVNYQKQGFGNDYKQAKIDMDNINVNNIVVLDSEGNNVCAEVTDLGSNFGYDLPKVGFRQPYYARQLEIKFTKPIDPLSYEVFTVAENIEITNKSKSMNFNSDNNTIQNDVVKLTLNSDGTLNIIDLDSMEGSKSIIKFVDHGDIGNEYMFGAVKNDIEIEATLVDSKIEVSELAQIIKAKYELLIPVSAADTLYEEHRAIVDYHTRETKRSDQMISMSLKVKYELVKEDIGVNMTVEYENKAGDHRLQMLIETNEDSNTHDVDTIFETISRPNTPGINWENSEFDHHQSKFLSLNNSQFSKLTIANLGLCEYSIRNKNTYAITLLRSTGELGDWGHFETPEAQEKRNNVLNLKLYIHTNNKSEMVYNDARNAFVSLPSHQLTNCDDSLYEKNSPLLSLVKSSGINLSAVKRNLQGDLIVRVYAPENSGTIAVENYHLIETNFLEENEYAMHTMDSLKQKEIKTYILKEE